MTSIFFFCDDASHPHHVAVTNFERATSPTGVIRWQERYTSRAAQGSRESGLTLVANEPVDVVKLFETPTDQLEGLDVRDKYVLTCRKCRRRPIKVQGGKLAEALSMCAAASESRVSLSDLRAILSALAKGHG